MAFSGIIEAEILAVDMIKYVIVCAAVPYYRVFKVKNFFFNQG